MSMTLTQNNWHTVFLPSGRRIYYTNGNRKRAIAEFKKLGYDRFVTYFTDEELYVLEYSVSEQAALLAVSNRLTVLRPNQLDQLYQLRNQISDLTIRKLIKKHYSKMNPFLSRLKKWLFTRNSLND